MVQTNGANTVAVSANGTVPLATVLSGTAYTVTVSAQPTALSQTCTVTNPSGTLTANVTLPITCVTNNYPITANVTGLAGTGLALQINAACRRSGGCERQQYCPCQPGQRHRAIR